MRLEKWKAIPFNENYEVSDYGNVRSIGRVIKRSDNRIVKLKSILLKKQMWAGGYYFIVLSNSSITKQYSIHRLVAITFLSNPQNKPQVNHKNGIKTDNRVENLEWVTMGENNAHAYRTGIKRHHKCWLGKTGYSHNKSKEVIEFENGIEKKRYGSATQMAIQVGMSNGSIAYYIKNRAPFKGKTYQYAVKEMETRKQ